MRLFSVAWVGYDEAQPAVHQERSLAVFGPNGVERSAVPVSDLCHELLTPHTGKCREPTPFVRLSLDPSLRTPGQHQHLPQARHRAPETRKQNRRIEGQQSRPNGCAGRHCFIRQRHNCLVFMRPAPDSIPGPYAEMLAASFGRKVRQLCIELSCCKRRSALRASCSQSHREPEARFYDTADR